MKRQLLLYIVLSGVYAFGYVQQGVAHRGHAVFAPKTASEVSPVLHFSADDITFLHNTGQELHQSLRSVFQRSKDLDFIQVINQWQKQAVRALQARSYADIITLPSGDKNAQEAAAYANKLINEAIVVINRAFEKSSNHMNTVLFVTWFNDYVVQSLAAYVAMSMASEARPPAEEVVVPEEGPAVLDRGLSELAPFDGEEAGGDFVEDGYSALAPSSSTSEWEYDEEVGDA